MKALITGGAGFIGSNLADRLIEDGHSVVIIDNLSTGNEHNINQKATFYPVDIRESAKVDEIIKSEGIDYIFHLAAQMDVRRSVEDPVFDGDVNVIGSLKLLQTAAARGVKKLIFASTGGAIYGEQDYFPADENHPLNPLSPYGVSKLSFEKYLFCFSRMYDIDYVALRYSNVYGPRQNPHGEAGVVAIFIEKMLKGDQPVINGDGKQTRDFVYVEDVVNANIVSLNDGISGAYNVSTGVEHSVNALFHKLVTITGITSKEVHGPAKMGEQERSVITFEKLGEETGWKPLYSFDEGLEKTVKYFKENG